MDPSRSPRLNNIIPNPDSWSKDPPSLQRMSVNTTYCLDLSWRLSPIRSGIVPNYELAPDLEKTEILRVVVRENLTETLIDRLISDLASSKLPIFFSFPWLFFLAQIEITEGLAKQDGSLHALATLGTPSHAKRSEQRPQVESGRVNTGTYAKTCWKQSEIICQCGSTHVIPNRKISRPVRIASIKCVRIYGSAR